MDVDKESYKLGWSWVYTHTHTRKQFREKSFFMCDYISTITILPTGVCTLAKRIFNYLLHLLLENKCFLFIVLHTHKKRKQ